jgi:hypothetical protein
MADSTTNASTTDVPLDDEAKQLKLLQIKAEARKAIADAQLSPAQSTLSDAQSKLLANPVDLGDKGGSSLAAVVASAALTRVAATIADTVKKQAPNGRVLVVEDRAVAESDVVYALVTGRLKLYEDAFAAIPDQAKLKPAAAPPVKEEKEEKLVQPAFVPPPLALLAGVGGLLVDAVALFKTEFKVGSRDVLVSQLALIAEVVDQLRGSVTVILPGFRLVKDSQVFQQFNRVLGLRYDVEYDVNLADNARVQPKSRRADNLATFLADQRTQRAKALADNDAAKASRIDAVIADAQKSLDEIDGNEEYQTLRANLTTIRNVLTAFDAFAASLTAIPSGAKYSPLVAAALREQLQDPNKKETHVLYVEISSAGADVVTHSGAFWSNQKAAFLGAVQATYLLASADGTIEASGTVMKSGIATYDFKELKFETPKG